MKMTRWLIGMPERRMGRRSFLVGATAAGLMAACGGDDDTATGEFQLDVEGSDGAVLLRPVFPQSGVWVAGIPQRLPFVLVDEFGPLREDAAPETIEVEVRSGDQVVSTATLARGRVVTPFYALVATFDAPGIYEVAIPGSTSPIAVELHDRSDVALVQVGDALRSVVTPTLDDDRDVDPICTRTPEFCPWHDESLADVVAAGRPLALMISTPGFCQTDVCGPVLELLSGLAPEYPEVTIVHAEVYAYPAEVGRVDEPELTEAVATYSLSYEPTLIVADASGTVTARLDFTFDAAEIAAALATATA